jgi:hypothetical protein
MKNGPSGFRILLLLFGLHFLYIETEATTAFEIHSDPSCSNGLSLTNVKMVCSDDATGGSSTCVLGDSAHVTGTLNIPSSGLYGKSMTTKVCLFGFYPCREVETNGDFCDTFGLSSYGCPTTGEYNIEKTFDLPVYDGSSLGKWIVIDDISIRSLAPHSMIFSLLSILAWPIFDLTVSFYHTYIRRIGVVLCRYLHNYQR